MGAISSTGSHCEEGQSKAGVKEVAAKCPLCSEVCADKAVIRTCCLNIGGSSRGTLR